MKKNKGFTIIEVMVVMAILMILIAIVIPNYKSWKNEHKAKQPAAIEQVQPNTNELEKLE